MQFVNKILTTTIDYPGHTAFTIFTVGCNLDCVFCHNRSIIDDVENHIPTVRILDKLRKRVGFIKYLTITGGEPCIHGDRLVYLCQKLKQMGYHIKLDTNGLYPEILKILLNQHLIEYVAMDIKSDLRTYAQFLPDTLEANHPLINNMLHETLKESISILSKSMVDHEYRTTPTKESCTVEDFISIGKDLTLAYKDKKSGDFPVWYIQKTRPVEDAVYEIYSDEERNQIVAMMCLNFPFVDVRLR